MSKIRSKTNLPDLKETQSSANELDSLNTIASTDAKEIKIQATLDCTTTTKQEPDSLVKREHVNYCSSICQMIVRFGIFVSHGIQILKLYYDLFVYLLFFIINAILFENITINK